MVTVVINNAGITIPKLLLDLSDDDWNNVIDTNPQRRGLRCARDLLDV